MSAVGIKTISTYVPHERLDGALLMQKFGVDRKFLEKKTGSLSLARSGVDETTTDMACLAFEGLLKKEPTLLADVGLLVVVTQTPDNFGLPHISSRVHGRFGLSRNVAAFDVSLGCSGWVYALSICRSFMQTEGVDHGVLITSDPYSKIINPNDRDTAMIFGDAATATYLTASGPEWAVGKGIFGTDGSQGNCLKRHTDGFLHMNGRRVFEFSATVVPACIKEVLLKNEVNERDVDLFLMHQGSKYIVETIGERIEAASRTPYFAAEVGNTVSSSIPLALSTLGSSGVKRVLVAGFGVGLSWAANILEKNL